MLVLNIPKDLFYYFRIKNIYILFTKVQIRLCLQRQIKNMLAITIILGPRNTPRGKTESRTNLSFNGFEIFGANGT